METPLERSESPEDDGMATRYRDGGSRSLEAPTEPLPPSEWYLARVTMDHEACIEAAGAHSDAVAVRRESLRRAHDAGVSWIKLARALGVDRIRAYRMAYPKGSKSPELS